MLDWRGCFGQGIKWEAGQMVWVWTLGLTFGGFTLYPTEGSNPYMLLIVFNPFLWTLNKVWPFNLTAS
jgi:hypothetical protein